MTLIIVGVRGILDSAGHGSYFGGPSEVTAFTTVVLEIPNRRAMLAFGTPSADNLLINAQSSTVITLQSLRVFTFRAPLPSSFQPPSTAMASFSSVADTEVRSPDQVIPRRATRYSNGPLTSCVHHLHSRLLSAQAHAQSLTSGQP